MELNVKFPKSPTFHMEKLYGLKVLCQALTFAIMVIYILSVIHPIELLLSHSYTLFYERLALLDYLYAKFPNPRFLILFIGTSACKSHSMSLPVIIAV